MWHRNPVCSFLWLASVSWCFAQTDAAQDGLPMMPIPASAFEGWTNAFVLQNKQACVAVAAGVGRIVHVGWVGRQNLLYVEEAPGDRDHPPEAPAPRRAYGGDGLWPVARGRWLRETGSPWPPPASPSDEGWTGNAWKSSDGALHCQISRAYPAPLSVRVTRQVTLSAEGAHISVRQRIERSAASRIPVCLRHVCRLAAPASGLLPADPASRFERRWLSFLTPPRDGDVRQFGQTLWVRGPPAGRYRLGTDSALHWGGALQDGRLIFIRAVPDDTAGTYPDRGCTTEVVLDPAQGYAAIETLSVEARLQPGRHIENTVHIEIHAQPPGLDRPALAAWIESHAYPAAEPSRVPAP